MLANNNRTIISHMAVRVLKRNKRRYGFLVTAVVLATFMVFSTLTVGETYFKMEYIQNLRSRGADYDAMVVGGIGEEQKRLCQEQLGVANAGMTAYSGSIASAGNNIPLRAGLVWGDEDYWEQLKKPVLKKLEGRYPQKENEIMVNAEIMEKAGLGDIKTGDTLTLTYEKLEERVTKEFQVSGVFSEYGNEKIFYVSKSFYEQSGYKLGYDGMLYIKFTHPIVPKGMQEELGESLHLNKRQAVIMTAGNRKDGGNTGGAGQSCALHLSERVAANLQYPLLVGLWKYPLLWLDADARDDRGADTFVLEETDVPFRKCGNYGRNPFRSGRFFPFDSGYCKRAGDTRKKCRSFLSACRAGTERFAGWDYAVLWKQKGRESGSIGSTCGCIGILQLYWEEAGGRQAQKQKRTTFVEAGMAADVSG